MNTFFASIFVFLLIIALHEFGHFAIAKLVGIKVNEFSIGMGPKLFQKKKKETKYTLRALPIGGYVAMEGEEESSDDPRSFNNAPVLNRLAVIVSGAGMNFLLAFLAFFLSFLFIGNPSNFVGEIVKDSPAYYAQIQPKDKIISINNTNTSNWNEIVEEINNSKGKITLEIERNGQIIEKDIEPDRMDDRIVIGISRSTDIFTSFVYAGKTTIETIVVIIDLLSKLFSGGFSINALSGPVGVVQAIGKSAQYGMGSLLFLTGYISANLGFMNLLPIPALDGGKVVFLLIEFFRGKPVDENLEMKLSMISISLLFGLMIYVTIFGDLVRILNI